MKSAILFIAALSATAAHAEEQSLLSIPLTQSAQARQMLCAYAEGSIKIAEIDMRSISNQKMRNYLIELEPDFGPLFAANDRLIGYKPYAKNLCHISIKAFKDFWVQFKSQ